ncbi:MAG: DJ-1/PfpI family protein [Natronosporangium sp.]
MLIAESHDPITGDRGIRVLPDHTLDDHPPLDVLLVPGGDGKREVSNPVLVDWVRRTAQTVDWLTSVCVGAFLLHEGQARREIGGSPHTGSTRTGSRRAVMSPSCATPATSSTATSSPAKASRPASTWPYG